MTIEHRSVLWKATKKLFEFP